MISVVLFDLDDTLFAHRRAVEDGVVAHLRSLDGFPDFDAAAEAARWRDLEEQHYSSYLAGRLDYLGQRRARARGFLAPYGIPLTDDTEAEAWFEDYLHAYRARWTLHDDAMPTLVALRNSGIRLGVITNGVTHFQQPKLDALKLSDLLEHVVTSGDFGEVKPHPSIFLHACRVFGVEPAEAMYVGDRLDTDAVGAARAGLAGVWLSRANPSEADVAEARAAGVNVIRSLDGVPDLLA